MPSFFSIHISSSTSPSPFAGIPAPASFDFPPSVVPLLHLSLLLALQHASASNVEDNGPMARATIRHRRLHCTLIRVLRCYKSKRLSATYNFSSGHLIAFHLVGLCETM